MKKLRNTNYIRREWLNDPDSPSTGNIVAYDGDLLDCDNEPYHSTFFRVSDCHVTANIHKASYDTDDDFINKMKRIRSVLDDFINHLESTHKK
jgi:hypothetical protein